MLRSEDYALFPHCAAFYIIYIVYLIEDDVMHILQSINIVEDSVSKYLSGHNQRWRLGVYDHVAGYNAHLIAIIIITAEISVFLIAQSFDRRCIYDLLASFYMLLHHILSNERFASSRRCCHDHRVILLY